MKTFVEPSMEVVKISATDIIKTSGCCNPSGGASETPEIG